MGAVKSDVICGTFRSIGRSARGNLRKSGLRAILTTYNALSGGTFETLGHCLFDSSGETVMTRLGTIGAACLAVELAASSPALARGGHVGGGGGFHAAGGSAHIAGGGMRAAGGAHFAGAGVRSGGFRGGRGGFGP